MNAHDSSLDQSTRARGRPCASGPGRALSRLEPWLLLLLAENPAHGYELLEHLKALPEAPNADRGHLYRTLRRLEEQGLVTSTWQVAQAGAARMWPAQASSACRPSADRVYVCRARTTRGLPG